MGTTREFLVGLVFFGLLLLLFVFTIVLTDLRLGPEPPSLDIHFANVGGLEEGDEVWINGYRSGRVAAVVPQDETDLIRVRVHFDREPRLYGDASFQVKAASPLGGRILDIDRGASLDRRTDPERQALPEILDPEAFHRGTATGDVLTEAAQLIQENRPSIRSLIANLDTLSVALAADGPETVARLRSTIENLEVVSASLRRGEGALGRLLSDPEVDRTVTAMIARFDAISRDLEEGKGVLGTLLRDEQLAEDMRLSVRGIRDVTRSLNEGDGTLARLLHDGEMYRTAVGILTDIRGITSQLSPERGIGKFLVDDSTWSRLSGTLAKLDETVTKVRDAAMTPDNLVGYFLGDEEPVIQIRQTLRNLNLFIEDTRENSPISTFAGFLFSAF